MAKVDYETETACVLDAAEAKALGEFIYVHKVRMACNMDISIGFSQGSGIGRNTIVKCKCGEEKDITNYASW